MGEHATRPLSMPLDRGDGCSWSAAGCEEGWVGDSSPASLTPIPWLTSDCCGRLRPGLQSWAVERAVPDIPGGPKRILVILPTWVGDFVMATPTLRAIRDRFKQAKITFLMVPNLGELVEGGDWMDEVVEWPRRGEILRGAQNDVVRDAENDAVRGAENDVLGGAQNDVVGFLKLARRLRRCAFDLAVLLPNSFRSGLMAMLSGVPRRVGYDRDARGFLLTDRLPAPRAKGRAGPHPICRYYGRIAARLGCPEPDDTLELFTTSRCEDSVEQRLVSLGIAQRKPLVVISPGASYGAAKLWLPERFAAVADQLSRSLDAAVIVTCGPGEEPIAQRINLAATDRTYLFDDPRLTLGELKALIKRADLLIGNDAGPRHIAKAFNVPVVTVFGPTHQAWTDTSYPDERKVSIRVDCGPCQQKICPLGHHQCMTGVTVKMVYDRCIELLEGRLARLAC